MTRAEEKATPDEAEAALDVLTSARHRWARLPLDRKLPYLDALRTEVLAAAEDWVAAAVRGKRIPEGSPLKARNGSPAPMPCSRGSRRRARRWARWPPAATRSRAIGSGSARTARPSCRCIPTACRSGCSCTATAPRCACSPG